MNWEEHSALKRGERKFTLWYSHSPRYWAVTEDRGRYDVQPTNDLNHATTKRGALENWKRSLERR